MRCSYCKLRAVHYAQHFGKFLCRSHLEGYLLRKLRRNLNKYRLVSPNDTVAIEDDGSPVSAAAKAVFKKAIKDWPVKVVSPQENHTRLLVPHTLESETTAIVWGLADGVAYHSGYADGKTIAPFRDFSSKELFALGWLEGCTTEGHSNWLQLGTASQLNLLRSWNQIQEFSRRPRSTGNKAGKRRRRP